MSSSSRTILARCATAVSCAFRPVDLPVDLEFLFPEDRDLGLEDLPARFKDFLLGHEDSRRPSHSRSDAVSSQTGNEIRSCPCCSA